MKLYLSAPLSKKIDTSIRITGSKSETNRMLLLRALYPNITLENLSNADDRKVMEEGIKVKKGVVDIHHAGTAMRFLTAYFASQEGKEVILTGSSRMKERPIKILVEALQTMGAEISYLENIGFPPIKIKGKRLVKDQVTLPANISSQYISALLLIAPQLENGITLKLEGKITSIPYIKMTLGLLEDLGMTTSFEGNIIKVSPKESVKDQTLVVESDWSAASYYYSVVALADIETSITLSAYKENSLQGDSVLSEIYRNFGVETTFLENAVKLKKIKKPLTNKLNLALDNAPDIAQTIAVTCFGLGVECHLTGLHTLPIKETDRLAAMKTELERFGASVAIDHESLSLKFAKEIASQVAIDTYHDHRMAMAFAPLAMKTSFYVNDAGVVSKSYPDFWRDFKTLGFEIEEV